MAVQKIGQPSGVAASSSRGILPCRCGVALRAGRARSRWARLHPADPPRAGPGDQPALGRVPMRQPMLRISERVRDRRLRGSDKACRRASSSKRSVASEQSAGSPEGSQKKARTQCRPASSTRSSGVNGEGAVPAWRPQSRQDRKPAPTWRRRWLGAKQVLIDDRPRGMTYRERRPRQSLARSRSAGRSSAEQESVERHGRKQRVGADQSRIGYQDRRRARQTTEPVSPGSR